MMTSNHKLYHFPQTTIHLVIIVAAVHDSLFVCFCLRDKSHVSVTYLISNNVSVKLTSDIDSAILSDLMVLHYSWYGHVDYTCINSSLRSCDI